MKKISSKNAAKSIKNKAVKANKNTTKNKQQKIIKNKIKTAQKQDNFEAYSDQQMLEMLLNFSARGKDTKKLAAALIKKYSSLNDVLNASYYELEEIEGIGNQSPLFLNLVREIITRYRYEKMQIRKNIYNKKELYNYCLTHLQNKRQEFFEVIFLNSKKHFITTRVISEGDLDNASVSPRKIIELILKYGAKYIICVHNHPSGDPSPSAEDYFTTQQLQRTLNEMSVSILDHVIVGEGKVYSMDRGSYLKFRK